jgi:hypothetical protein
MSGILSATRRLRRVWSAVVVVLALTASPAFAVFPGGSDPGGHSGGGGGTGGGGGGGGGHAPEIGVGAAASALTLLAGATLIALDRRRRALKAEPQA